MTHVLFVDFTTHIRLSVDSLSLVYLQPWGEMLVVRLSTKQWKKSTWIYMACDDLGLPGYGYHLDFSVFGSGVMSVSQKRRLLPGKAGYTFVSCLQVCWWTVLLHRLIYFPPLYRYVFGFEVYGERFRNHRFLKWLKGLIGRDLSTSSSLRRSRSLIPAHTITHSYCHQSTECSWRILTMALVCFWRFSKRRK